MSTQHTPSEKLRVGYPNLYNFLVSSFPETDFEDLEDDEATERFALVTDLRTIDGVIAEGRQLLELGSVPWDVLGDWANRNFTSAPQAQLWLESMLRILETGRVRRLG